MPRMDDILASSESTSLKVEIELLSKKAKMYNKKDKGILRKALLEQIASVSSMLDDKSEKEVAEFLQRNFPNSKSSEIADEISKGTSTKILLNSTVQKEAPKPETQEDIKQRQANDAMLDKIAKFAHDFDPGFVPGKAPQMLERLCSDYKNMYKVKDTIRPELKAGILEDFINDFKNILDSKEEISGLDALKKNNKEVQSLCELLDIKIEKSQEKSQEEGVSNSKIEQAKEVCRDAIAEFSSISDNAKFGKAEKFLISDVINKMQENADSLDKATEENIDKTIGEINKNLSKMEESINKRNETLKKPGIKKLAFAVGSYAKAFGCILSGKSKDAKKHKEAAAYSLSAMKNTKSKKEVLGKFTKKLQEAKKKISKGKEV